MRRLRNDGGFFLCLAINLIFNIEWSIPAWFCLIGYFIWDFSFWFFIILFGAWFLYILLITLFLCLISKHSSEPINQKENVNPYSKKGNPYQNTDL